MKINLLLFLLALIACASQALVVPHPKIPLKEIDTQEYKQLQQNGDFAKLRILSSRHASEFYDEFVRQYKQLNNTAESPFPEDLRAQLVQWVEKAPDQEFKKSNIELLQQEQKMLETKLAFPDAIVGKKEEPAVAKKAVENLATTVPDAEPVVIEVTKPKKDKTTNYLIAGALAIVLGLTFLTGSSSKKAKKNKK